MIELELLYRWLHVIGACVLLGTGAGIAFFMVMAHLTGKAELIAHTASTVVIADAIFTATAAIAQPITGIMLAYQTGWPLSTGWIVLSLALYIFVGLFWLPVIWIQIKMRNLARQAALTSSALPAQYYKLFRIWFACGFPAFFAVLAIVWLMLERPDITLF